MTDALKISKANGILEVVIDRPKANAIDNPTSREPGQLFLDFLADDSLRVAILSGAGERFFSAGWDLKAAAEGEAVDSDYGPGGFGGITELTQRDKPIIVAVNGNAIGGGVDIMVSADLAVAADHAQFWTPEVKVGVIADATAIRLPKRIPRAVEHPHDRRAQPDAARVFKVQFCLLTEHGKVCRLKADRATRGNGLCGFIVACLIGKQLLICVKNVDVAFEFEAAAAVE